VLCWSSSWNPDGSGSALVGAGDGGVWRSMLGFAGLVFEMARAMPHGDRSMIPSFGEQRGRKVDLAACSSNISQGSV
jgi:hypothetical protein